MGQVRWAGWTMAIATALVISGGQATRADIASDKPAAIVVYPKVVFDSTHGADTVIRLTNTNQDTPINVHCFYLDANNHCSGGPTDGAICIDASTCGGGLCIPSWQETDFHAILTPGQPIEWKASDGLSDTPTCDGGDNARHSCRLNEPSDCPGGLCKGLPLPFGVCLRNPFRRCGTDADCNPFPGGPCTQSNAGTNIPPVPEDPFVGELKCIAVDDNGAPVARNELKGEGILETATPDDLDVASYNAIGIQATGAPIGGPDLTLGTGPDAEYNGCPNFLILNHFFDGAVDPVPKGENEDNIITTDLTLVPCSEDLLRQIPGAAVVQYLVFNEFEQRFSTSKLVRCFQEIQLCNIDTRQCTNSIFNVKVAGTLTGQTRLNPIGVATPPPFASIPSGLLGVAIERHTTPPNNTSGHTRSAAFNLHMQGARDTADTITIP